MQSINTLQTSRGRFLPSTTQTLRYLSCFSLSLSLSLLFINWDSGVDVITLSFLFWSKKAGSLDEAYLDVTDFLEQHRDSGLTGSLLAEQIRREIYECVCLFLFLTLSHTMYVCLCACILAWMHGCVCKQICMSFYIVCVFACLCVCVCAM